MTKKKTLWQRIRNWFRGPIGYTGPMGAVGLPGAPGECITCFKAGRTTAARFIYEGQSLCLAHIGPVL